MFDLTIIIPNYNTKAILRECLLSIYQHTKDITFEVIVVDDNSPDGSAQMVAEEFPSVVLLCNTESKLYAKNNNLGLELSKARYACLLNSDTYIKANAFKSLVSFMDAHPDAAACTPKLLNPDGSVQSSVRRFPDVTTLILQGLNWHKLFPQGKVGREYYASDLDHDRAQLIHAVGSTALVLRRSNWEEGAGKLDERFPLYSVDLAYCLTMHRKGLKLYYTPDAEIFHYGSQSADQVPLKHLKSMHQGFHTLNEHYDYFGGNFLVKKMVSLAIEARYLLKRIEHKLSKDKRLLKGPGRPSFESLSKSSQPPES